MRRGNKRELPRVCQRTGVYMRITRAGFAIGTAVLLNAAFVSAQTFAVASIRPSAEDVKFEHDGKTEITPGTLTMRDVTAATCIKFAYGVQDSQISGPDWLQSDHFDILAKADSPVAEDQLKLMMQALLADRFKLAFHRQNKELSAYAMTVAKGGAKLKESAPGTKPYRENSAVGSIVRAWTMKEWADFISGPMRTPVVDMTGLKGRYDFSLDFTAYLPGGENAMNVAFDNANGIMIAAMQGELGLKMESRNEAVEVLVIDHVEQPSAN
jgi:uncharacterized protein (TIGR03435 family)